YSWRVIFWTRPAGAVSLQGPTTTSRPINAVRRALRISRQRRSHQLVGELLRRSSSAVATSREGHRQPRAGPAGQRRRLDLALERVEGEPVVQMSHILQVPVEFFFEGAPNAPAPHGSIESAD